MNTGVSAVRHLESFVKYTFYHNQWPVRTGVANLGPVEHGAIFLN